MKKKLNIEITEIFMAKYGIGNKGFDRCFHGTIKRKTDVDGNPFVFSEIKVNDGYIKANGKDQWELGEKLDELVIYSLDHNYGELDNYDISMN